MTMYGRRNPEPAMRTAYRWSLEERIESMIENGELDPDDADSYYTDQMDSWDDGYADMLYDQYKDRRSDDEWN